MKKVMVVDDNDDIVNAMKVMLQKEGYSTAEAHTGQEFLDKVEKEKPDLVLLDIMMPGLTTKQVLNGLKEKNMGDLKIVIVTVVRFSEEESETLMKDSNVVDYVVKPFKVADIMERIAKQLPARN